MGVGRVEGHVSLWKYPTNGKDLGITKPPKDSPNKE